MEARARQKQEKKNQKQRGRRALPQFAGYKVSVRGIPSTLSEVQFLEKVLLQGLCPEDDTADAMRTEGSWRGEGNDGATEGGTGNHGDAGNEEKARGDQNSEDERGTASEGNRVSAENVESERDEEEEKEEGDEKDEHEDTDDEDHRRRVIVARLSTMDIEPFWFRSGICILHQSMTTSSKTSFAILKCQTQDAVRTVFKALHGKEVEGKTISVGLATSQKFPKSTKPGRAWREQPLRDVKGFAQFCADNAKESAKKIDAVANEGENEQMKEPASALVKAMQVRMEAEKRRQIKQSRKIAARRAPSNSKMSGKRKGQNKKANNKNKNNSKNKNKNKKKSKSNTKKAKNKMASS
eukprot:g1513.t1